MSDRDAKPAKLPPDEAHVMPTFGREHDTSTECWCKPKHDVKDPRVIVHRVMS